jgi:hypothetical protein
MVDFEEIKRACESRPRLGVNAWSRARVTQEAASNPRKQIIRTFLVNLGTRMFVIHPRTCVCEIGELSSRREPSESIFRKHSKLVVGDGGRVQNGVEIGEILTNCPLLPSSILSLCWLLLISLIVSVDIFRVFIRGGIMFYMHVIEENSIFHLRVSGCE